MRGSATRGASPTNTTRSPAATLQTLGGGAVTIEGGLCARRQATNRDAALPHGYRMLEAAGNLENLRIAAGTSTGRYQGPVFMDSDVYKWIEAAAYEHARIPGDWLLSHMATAIDITGAAQVLPGAGRSRRHPDRRARDRPERGSRIPLGPRAPRGRRGPARGGVPGRHVVVGPPALSPLPFRAAAGSAAGRAHGDPVRRLGESKPGRHARVGPAGYNLIAVGLATASFVTSIKRRDA
jgi:hypothetical protein